jgi:peptide/nickel transport system substrate-binding protein
MKITNVWALLAVGMLACVATVGCTGKPSSEPVAVEKPTDGDEARPTESGAESDEPTEPAFRELEPFDPPPFDELDAQAEWIDQPVRDALADFRIKQADEPRLATVDEALRLQNNSAEDNEKILSVLGKLPQSDDEVDYDAVVLRRTGADMRSANPLFGSSVTEFEVSALTGVGLMSYDWNFEPFAPSDVVVSWQVSGDYMADKFVLRDDLTWSDGSPLTAHDFAFSFQAIMNPKVPATSFRTGTDKLRWVHAYDDHTLVIFHLEKSVTRTENIGFPIIPKHIYEESIKEDPSLQGTDYHVRFENSPVTCGPYELARRRRGQEIVLARRESYYMHNGEQVRRKPYIREVRLQIIEDPNTALLALKSGTIEETALTAEQWTTQTSGADYYARNTKTTGLEWVDFHFCWNVKTEFFSDARVRKAMSYAFDHDEMLDKVFYNLYEPSNGVFHHTAKFASDKPQPFKQNLDMAEDLLDEAGWVDSDFDGVRDKRINGRLVPFEFTIICGSTPNSLAVCELLKQSLIQIGIVCNVRPLEFTVLQQKSNDHDFQASMGGWGTGTDPSTLKNIFGSGEGRNYGNYSNPEIDRLFEEGEKEFDEEKRWQIYTQIHEILYEDQPYTWLFFRSSFYGFNKKLRGYNFSPRGPYGVDPGFGSIWVPATAL